MTQFTYQQPNIIYTRRKKQYIEMEDCSIIYDWLHVFMHCDKTSSYVEFEVLKAVAMESFVFWDITPCSLQCQRVRWARNQHELGSKQSSTLHGVISRKTELFKFVRVKARKFVAMVTIRNRTISQLSYSDRKHLTSSDNRASLVFEWVAITLICTSVLSQFQSGENG
jgi:hypothetical protein